MPARTLNRVLEIVELIAIAGAVVGILFRYMQFAGALEILMISLCVLACIYFIGAFRPVVLEDTGEKKGFGELLAIVIVPKLVGIAGAVILVGVLYRLIPLFGAQEMLMIGIMALAISGVMFLVAKMISSSPIPTHPMIYRLVPLLVIGAYFLFNHF